MVLAACVSTVPAPRPVDGGRPVSLSHASITAPVAPRDSYRELRQLADQQLPAARLREAFILIETHQLERALSTLNAIVYGPVEPGPAVESFARYLRALAFEQRGERERAEHERALALARAVDPELRRHLAPGAGEPDAAEPAPGTFAVMPRSTWGARPPGKMDRMGPVTRVTVHHSGMLSRDRGRPAAVATLEAIQRHHQIENGWADIGYHYLIDAAGRIWQGRDDRWQGAHAGDPGRNRGNVGICVLGNFIDGGQRPSKEQVASLRALLDRLCREHGLDHDDILTHRELRVTTCPGRYLQAEVDRIRAAGDAQAQSF